MMIPMLPETGITETVFSGAFEFFVILLFVILCVFVPLWLVLQFAY